MGRPTSLTPRIQDAVCRALKLGSTWELAAKASGLTTECMRVWRVKGRQGIEPYAGFVAAVEKAEAAGVEERLSRIRKAAKAGAWQADAWLLERRYAQAYGRTVIEVQDGGTAPDNDRERRTARIDELLAKGRGTSDAKPIDN